MTPGFHLVSAFLPLTQCYLSSHNNNDPFILISWDPDKRLTPNEALKHAFIRDGMVQHKSRPLQSSREKRERDHSSRRRRKGGKKCSLNEDFCYNEFIVNCLQFLILGKIIITSFDNKRLEN